MKHDIFLSYKRTDSELATALVAGLEKRGIEVWWDQDIAGGQDWRTSIVENLAQSSALVILFSEECNTSKQLGKELAVADGMDKVVIPVLIEDTAPKGEYLYELASRNWIQIFPDAMAKMDQLVENLISIVESDRSQTTATPISASEKSGAPTGETAIASSEEMPKKEKNSTDAKSRRNFLPFRLFDLVPLAVIVYFSFYAADRNLTLEKLPEFLSVARSPKDAFPFILLTSILYCGLIFPLRYYLRRLSPYRSFGMLLLSFLTLAILVIPVSVHFLGGNPIEEAALFFALFTAVSVVSFLVYAILSGLRARRTFKANTKKL